MSAPDDEEIVSLVKADFRTAGIEVTDVTLRHFPGEVIVVVEVRPDDFQESVALASKFDSRIPGGFITVKRASQISTIGDQKAVRIESLSDLRVNSLVELLDSRSRTSEHQPSLKYVPDALQNITSVTSKRHHLIFGRRGVGKTALMLEAKGIVERRGSYTFWLNIQAIRSLNAYEAFLTAAHRLCEVPGQIHSLRAEKPRSVVKSEELRGRISKLLSGVIDKQVVHRIIPEIQDALGTFLRETQESLFVFLDDFHYLAMNRPGIAGGLLA